MKQYDVETVAVDDIIPYSNNQKHHTPEQVQAIANSIRQFGFRQNLVIDKDNIIVIGHGRYEAAKLLGMQEVPCMRIEDLTPEQIRALRVVDNKLNESEWNFGKLDIEIEELKDTIDFGEFGFDFDDLHFQVEEQELKHIQNKENVRQAVLDILNLGKGQFLGEGKYDIPILQPVKSLPPIKEWIGFNYVLSDTEPQGKAVHFFIDDYQFERIWNNPEKYVDKLKQYVCVATPDFSPYGDMPLALQICNHYRKHWVGVFLQQHGVTVIPTIRRSTDVRSKEWYLDGEPKGGIVIMSSMWTSDNSIADISRDEYETMKKVLSPTKIFIYGNHTKYMGISETDNVEFIENFTSKRWEK